MRHLDAACPFCGGSLPDSLRAPAPLRPTKRLGRAALFSFRALGAAGALALAAAGCGASTASETSDEPTTTTTSTSDDADPMAGANESSDIEEGGGYDFMPAAGGEDEAVPGDDGDIRPAYGAAPP